MKKKQVRETKGKKTSAKKKVLGVINGISTPPDPDARKWSDGPSFLSFVLLGFIHICRVLSLLQIIKYFYRLIAKWQNENHIRLASKDNYSKRINIPPIIPEIYFIFWFSIETIFYILKLHNLFTVILAYYYLFESIVWILYYAILRRFFEERYKIQHPLEYFVNLLIIIPTQALVLSNLYNGATWSQTISALLGNALDGEFKPFIGIIGALYGAVIISMIMGGFPSESSKKKKSHNVIIGFGDVVTERLLNNIDKEENPIVYDIRENALTPEQQKNYVRFIDFQTMILESKNHSIVWIETPSFIHTYYLKLLLDTEAGMIVMEKPITVLKDELNEIKSIIDSKDRRRIFFLSYYILEKALPLIYLKKNYLRIYEKYLIIYYNEKEYSLKTSDSDKDNTTSEAQWQTARKYLIDKFFDLGPLKSIEVNLCEKGDSRDWANDFSKYGGQLLETFIHDMLIASFFAGLPSTWSIISTSGNKRKSSFTLDAINSDGVEIHLTMKKGSDKKERKAVLTFSNGKINASFDKKEISILTNNVQECKVYVKPQYQKNYSIQVDLVKECFKKGLNPAGIDGLDNQIQVIEWLLNNINLF